MAANAQWTYMVYMAGDNNLSTAGDEDLKEMRQIGSTSNVNVLAQFDNAGHEGTRRIHIQRGGINEKIDNLGETDSGDPLVLEDFITWAYENYPADRYALILWNHGGGWEPDDLDRMARFERTKNWNVREASSRSASKLKKTIFRTSINKILNMDSSRSRAICCDDGSRHSLDTIELGKVFKYAKEKTGKSLDILGMDACLMSNLEVAYQLEPYVSYIVASEESEPNEGWPYSSILDVLTKNTDISTPDLCREIVNAYIKTYEEWGQSDVTQSALDLSKIKDATESLNLLAKALVDLMPDVAPAILKAQNKSMCFADYTLWDVSHFCQELSRLTNDDQLNQAIRDVIGKYKPQPENFIIAESHLGPSYSQCCGASVYFRSLPRVG